jgi:glycosyltransferase involved in cell wall biosynthesis
VRILIVEPHASGHHASYLRWLVQAAVRRRWGVVIATTSAALTHPSLTKINSDYSDVQIHVIEDFGGVVEQTVRQLRLLRREVRYWKLFKRATTEVRTMVSIDAVILPYVDYCFYALATLGSPFLDLPWCGISMRLAVAQHAADVNMPLPLRWRVAKRVLRARTLKALFVINPSVKDVPPNWCSTALLSKLHYLRDPAEYGGIGARQDSRSALGISDRDVAILVFGSIDERKGIDSLLSCLSSYDGLEDYIVVLAGKQSSSIQTLLRSAACTKLRSNGRLVEINRFLTGAEQDSVFAAADTVWVGYRNHNYMSGVLVLAGKAGLPVIGTDQGEIGRLITEHSLGRAVRIDQQTEVAMALRAMLEDDKRVEMGRRSKAAFEYHTVEGFGDSVLSAFDTESST